jgi:heme exporter protein C
MVRWFLLLWLCLVIWAAFFFILPAAGFQGQSSRIVVFHVPTAWVATLAFLVSCVVSIRYLMKRREIDDIRAAASAGLGLVFAVLATVTGSIFSRIEWGMFWNWDPRQISITILLLIYLAYFALRAAIVDPERRAAQSAVYAILAFVTVPFLVFVVPRITTSLHPDVIGDARAGGGGFDLRYLVVLLSSLAGFTGLFFWLYNIDCRLEGVRRQQQEELW